VVDSLPEYINKEIATTITDFEEKITNLFNEHKNAQMEHIENVGLSKII
jgi:hypothetical protein